MRQQVQFDVGIVGESAREIRLIAGREQAEMWEKCCVHGGHLLKVDRKHERGPQQKAAEVHPVRNWVHPSARYKAGKDCGAYQQNTGAPTNSQHETARDGSLVTSIKREGMIETNIPGGVKNEHANKVYSTYCSDNDCHAPPCGPEREKGQASQKCICCLSMDIIPY